MENTKVNLDIATKYSADPLNTFRSLLVKQDELELLGILGE